jgi:hypothetical protein
MKPLPLGRFLSAVAASAWTGVAAAQPVPQLEIDFTAFAGVPLGHVATALIATILGAGALLALRRRRLGRGITRVLAGCILAASLGVVLDVHPWNAAHAVSATSSKVAAKVLPTTTLDLTTSPTTLAVPGEALVQATNVGSQAIAITNVVLNSPASGQKLSELPEFQPSCKPGLVLQPGGSCFVLVEFIV